MRNKTQVQIMAVIAAALLTSVVFFAPQSGEYALSGATASVLMPTGKSHVDIEAIHRREPSTRNLTAGDIATTAMQVYNFRDDPSAGQDRFSYKVVKTTNGMFGGTTYILEGAGNHLIPAPHTIKMKTSWTLKGAAITYYNVDSIIAQPIVEPAHVEEAPGIVSYEDTYPYSFNTAERNVYCNIQYSALKCVNAKGDQFLCDDNSCTNITGNNFLGLAFRSDQPVYLGQGQYGEIRCAVGPSTIYCFNPSNTAELNSQYVEITAE